MKEEKKNPDIIYIEETPEDAGTTIQEVPVQPEGVEQGTNEPADKLPSQADNKEGATMTNAADSEVIDLRVIIKKLWRKKLWFLLVWIITGALASWYIVGIPRTYMTTTRIAPETDQGGQSSLGSIASSFGINLGDNGGSDAIYPLLYPDLMEDNGFVSRFFDIRVQSEDGVISTTYYDYLANYQARPWWAKYQDKVKKLLPKDEEPDKVAKKAGNSGEEPKFDPYYLNKKEDKVVKAIRSSVSFDYDIKTSCISITVIAQDRMICKQVADSVRERLQGFITDYRTSKARKDVDYYKKLADEAKVSYEKVRRQYAAFSDANTDISLPSLQAKMEDIENDMQLKYNAFTALNTQLQAAQAKLQEYTPAFTLLQGAAVPMKASGPKRMIFVAVMLFLATIVECLVIFRKELLA